MVEPSFHVTDPGMLRALAHPFRQRILWELAVRKYGRAADLAVVMGEPANTISYHLRALAQAGLVEGAPEFARDGRDRVWRLTHPEGLSASSDSPAADILETEQLEWMRDIVTERLPRQPGAARGVYLGAAMLTEAEANQMFEEVVEVLERWREHGAQVVSNYPADVSRIFHRIAALVGNR
ncbi:ArsR/SmtB family transcription factor [Leifsonia poae]|uniref:ArsR/SmtB family transcription factor n=1 Tax=Leifsonia poae TaxID=110933 RepID=UPI001CBE4A66|nr:helix-turn-helix domain-containing protein [Leifsonia poae]